MVFLLKKRVIIWGQDSKKTRAILVKTDRVSKYTLSVQKFLFKR